MPKYDGEIRIGTKLDTTGFEKGVDQMSGASDKKVGGLLDGLKENMEQAKKAWLDSIGVTPDQVSNGLFAMFKQAEKAYGAAGGEVAKTGEAMAAGEAAATTGASALAVTLGVVAAVLAAIVIVVALVVVGVIALAKTLVDAGRKAWAFAEQLIDGMDASMAKTNAYAMEVHRVKDMFDSVKQASYAAFAPLIEAAIPYIQQVVNWLVIMFNTIAMIIASLLKQNKVWQYVAGSTKTAAGAADNALASWDKINVLQQGGGPNAGAGQFTQIDVDPKALQNTMEKVKAWLKWLWEDILVFLHGRWNWFVEQLYTNFYPVISWFQTAWGNVKAWAADTWQAMVGVWAAAPGFFSALWGLVVTIVSVAWQNFLGWVRLVFDFLVTLWSQVPYFFSNLWEVVSAFFVITWTNMMGWVKLVWNFLTTMWGQLPLFFGRVWNLVSTAASIAWSNMMGWVALAWGYLVTVWGGVRAWFKEHVADPVEKAFTDTWDNIKTAFETAFTGIKNFAKTAINGVIGFLNGLISALVDGMNAVIGALNKIRIDLNAVPPFFPGVHLGVNIPPISPYQIPLLAQGAVIPPNSAFLAMLGDQRNGRNLELPEDLLRQIVRDEVGSMSVSVNFTGTAARLVQLLDPHVQRENIRLGPSLAEGL